MFTRSFSRLFSHLVREVDTKGFAGNFRKLAHINDASTQAQVRAAVKGNSNIVFCGHHGTGKLTLLRAIGLHYQQKLGLRVAFVSADNRRANRLDGFLLHHFIGLRMGSDELPSQEQLEGTLERHVRLVESTYASAFPSLSNTDVLVLDSLERVPPVVFASMEAVARRQRADGMAKPFGGLRVIAAADFWQLTVHPTSDTGGYIYQTEKWQSTFPRQVILQKSIGQRDPLLSELTVNALYGDLSMQDIKQLETLSMKDKPEAAIFLHREELGFDEDEEADNDNNEDDEEGDEECEEAPEATHSVSASSSTGRGSLLNDDVISNADAIARFTPKFPKQPSVRLMPPKYRQLKRTEIGNFLVNVLLQSSLPLSYGLVDALSVEVGSKVHLLLDGQESYGVAAGAVGEVMAIKEHHITVHFPADHRTVDVPRMRITCYHPDYPEVRYELQQFPLFPRQRLSPMSVLTYPNAYHVNLNGRRMADTNDLGNLLARMRSFDDFTLRNTADFAHMDGVMHEPTRIYYHEVMKKPMNTSPDHWCRNCKSFVPTKDFFAHWSSCVQSVRWCAECNKTIPLELLEPHKEKHQVVLCMDCGQGVEWRRWEAHRLACGAMMREISPDNEFLPLRTRQLALELGLDKRDLHTMRAFSRSMLPKSREQLL